LVASALASKTRRPPTYVDFTQIRDVCWRSGGIDQCDWGVGNVMCHLWRPLEFAVTGSSIPDVVDHSIQIGRRSRVGLPVLLAI